MSYSIGLGQTKFLRTIERKELPKSLSFKSYGVYLPKKLNLVKFTNENPLPALNNAKSPQKQIDNVLYVLGCINDVASNNKDLNLTATLGFTNLCATYLRKVVTDYKKILDWAVENELLESDDIYIIGEKCTGYRWHKNWGNELKHYDLVKPEIVKQKQRNVCNDTIIKYPELWQFHQGLEIDMSRVKEVLNSIKDGTIEDIKKEMKKPKNSWRYKDLSDAEMKEEINRQLITKQNSRYQAAEKFDDKRWCFKQDDNIERLHTNLTGIKRELRPLVSYQGTPLVGCDIVNSQPAISNVLFDKYCWENLNLERIILHYNTELRKSINHKTGFKDTPEILNTILAGNTTNDIIEFRNASLDGRVYELMMEKYEAIKSKSITRDEAKQLYLSILFTPTFYNNENQLYKDLKQEFPNVFEMYEWVNTGYEKFKNGTGVKAGETKGHNARGKDEQSAALSLILQNIESKLILDTAIPLILDYEPDIPIFPLHDSIVTTIGNEVKIHNWMKLSAFQLFGFTPMVNIE